MKLKISWKRFEFTDYDDKSINRFFNLVLSIENTHADLKFLVSIIILFWRPNPTG